MNSKYESEEARLDLARRIAREAIILLKNENNALPLEAGKTVALLGRTQKDVIIGGGGSGFSTGLHTLQIDEELEKAGLVLEGAVRAFYEKNREEELNAAAAAAGQQGDFFAQIEGLVASGAIYEIFGRYTAPTEEPEIPDEVIKAAGEATDTAILIIGRMSGGEECDRRIDHDYYLMDSEKKLIAKAAEAFSNIIVVYDVNGAVDTAWMNKVPQVRAAIFMGTSGEQAAGALADIVTGKVSPSGKLTQTLAMSYEAYPTAVHFSSNKDDPDSIKRYSDYGLSAEDNGSCGYDISPVTVYQEDIYLGYRYFDTFGEPVMFHFGHGLSYASFDWKCNKTGIKDGRLFVTAAVKNTSEGICGKEVLQLYVSAPDGKLEKPAKELKAYKKTKELAPGEEEVLELFVPLTDLASFDEEAKQYVIEAGTYKICLGTNSANTRAAGEICVAEDIVTRSVTADIGLLEVNKGKIDFLKKPAGAKSASGAGDCAEAAESKEAPDCGKADVLALTKDDIKTARKEEHKYDFSVPAAEGATLKDVADGKVSMEAFINQMTLDELAVLCNGYGPGLPFGGIAAKGAPRTLQYPDGTDIGANDHEGSMNGYINPALKKYAIPSCMYKDGPAFVGKAAWPTGVMMASTWSDELQYEFGSAIGAEAESLTIDSWLGPGMDMIRNPIGGRNFEYFSEDPVVTGRAAVNITKGAMENNAVTSCPKHFALNEQETYRRGKANRNIDAVDSVVSGRAARELYLKPFEMVVTEADPTTVMSSFNKVNGRFAGGSHVLCTEILRGEWGYDGVVVTDWGDMDMVVDGADAVAAGNDVVMPGGPPVIAQVKKGYEEGRVTLDEMKTAVAHLMNFVMSSASFRK